MTATATIQRPAPTQGPAAPAGFLVTTHKPDWLGRTSRPLFIADQNLRNRATFPRALGPWVLDSGGFMQLKNTGRWQFTVESCLQRIAMYQEKIGNLAWAAPMDYMCEDGIRAMTGFGRDAIRCHQELTTDNYLLAHQLWPRYGDGECPVKAAIQGQHKTEYLDHVALYRTHGVDLTTHDIVGLGSVCRRSSTPGIITLLDALSDLDRYFGSAPRRGLFGETVTERLLQGSSMKLHGFGVKREGLRMVGHQLHSADSMAWSMDALHEPPLQGHTHQHCQNCFDYAMQWSDDTAALFTDPDHQTLPSSLYLSTWES